MSNLKCVPREALKEYLAGWSDPEQSDLIENHLAECTDCEQTVEALEADPDTLVGFLQRASNSSAFLHSAQSGTARSEALAMEAALEVAKRKVPGAENSHTTVSESQWSPPSTEMGAYELLRPLASGGMGSVYLARHRKLGKEVAIKLLPARTFRNELFTARFQREIRAAGGLEHPAIVRATDAGEHQGIHYLVMEYIDGLDLSRIVQRTGPLAIGQACEIIRQVSLGLSHAHASGIIHRDIKPSNLMLSQGGTAKILDFGLARIGPWEEASAELTTVGQLMGTLDYMAPEQAENAEAVDYRADLYSLGATLFRLLCGRAPLAASPDLSPLAKLRLLATHQAPHLDTLREDAPKELVELVDSLLSRDPAHRPASADHVAERLEPFAEGHELPTLVSQALAAKPTDENSQLPHPSMQLPESATKPTSRGSGKLGWWLACALLPLTLLAGVWITLERQKGLLVIESDAEVAVRLLKDGEYYQELEVVPGRNVTKLFAGKYAVELAAASDALKVEDGTLTVARGDAAVATITWKQSEDSVGVVANSPPLPRSDAELKPGDRLLVHCLIDKTLDGWKATVASDGTLRIPFAGSVQVGGETIEGAQEKVRTALGKFYEEPQVELFFADVTQLGEVRQVDSEVASERVPAGANSELQVGDGIRFWSFADSNVQARLIVQADNTIRVPLVGTVDVKGLTLEQLQEVLEERYSSVLQRPGIQIFRDVAFEANFREVDQMVSQMAGAAVSSVDDSRNTNALGKEPLYEGKSLSSYLEMLAWERSPGGLGQAFRAIKALVSPNTAERISIELLAIMPRLDGGLRIQEGEGQTASTYDLDYGGFQILRKANPGEEYARLLVRELDTAGPEWKARLLSSAISRVDPEALGPVITWLESNVFASEKEDEFFELASQYYLLWLQSGGLLSSDEERIRQSLQSNPRFDREFWLNQLFSPENPGNIPNVQELMNLAKPHCLAVLREDDAPLGLVAQAATQLEVLASMSLLGSDEKELVGKLVEAQLERLKPEELTQLVGVHANYARVATPTLLDSGRNARFVGLSLRRISAKAKVIPVEKLLLLAIVLEADVQEYATEIVAATKERWSEVSDLLGDYRVELYWPTLQVASLQVSPVQRFSRGGSRDGSTSQFAGVTAEDWVAYLLYEQAYRLLPEIQEANSGTTDDGALRGGATRSGSSRNGPSRDDMLRSLGRSGVSGLSSRTSRSGMSPVLFRGRPLDEWLSILPREKSAEGITEALTALQAMVSEETSESICEVLQRELPSIGWKASQHYEMAFKVLYTALGPKYFSYLLDELKSENNSDEHSEWKTRILKSSLTHDLQFSFDEFEELHQWIVNNLLNQRSEWTDAIAQTYARLASDPNCPPALLRPLLEALRNSNQLGEDFWMGQPLMNSQANELWARAAMDHWVQALEDPGTSEVVRIKIFNELARARTWLIAGINQRWLELLDQDAVRKVCVKRLEYFLDNPERMKDPITIPAQFAVYGILPRNALRADWAPTSTPQGGLAAYEIVEVLQTLALLDNDLEKESQLADVLKRLEQSQLDLVARSWAARHGQNGVNLWNLMGWSGSRSQVAMPAGLFEACKFAWPLDDQQLSQYGLNSEQVLANFVYSEARGLQGKTKVSDASEVIEQAKQHVLKREFSRCDADQDGYLSLEEYAEFRPFLQENCGREMFQSAEGFTFDSFDRNQDQRVALEEVLDAREVAMQKGGLDQSRLAAREYLQWAEQQIAKYDRNQDGSLDEQEWQKMIIKPDGADANQDGIITAEEYANWRASRSR